MTLKVAIDALGLGRWGGGRTATLNLLIALGQLDGENRYDVFVEAPEPTLDAFPNFRQRIAPVHRRLPMRLWAQARLPAILRREEFDLVHHTRALGIYGAPCPSIVTIFDLTILALRQMYPRPDVWYWQHVQPRLLRRVDKVIAISDHTRRELEAYLGLDADRIAVVYPAPDDSFHPPADAEALAAIREKYHLAASFFLYVGIVARKKNLPTLLRAFARLRQDTDLPHKLVLAGRPFPTSNDEATVLRLIDELGLQGRVQLTGLVPQADLPLIYAAADLFVYPSLHEGFGLAPLEAMACGTPVITTRGGALPEATGEAAILMDDPLDAEALAMAMRQMVTDRALIDTMRQRGLQQAARFSYAQAARQTRDIYLEVTGAGRKGSQR
jgi:glycosyltransferase involved in cell wall biosynthesis